MKLTRTPSQRTSYNLKLTREEVEILGGDWNAPEDVCKYFDLVDVLVGVMKKEVRRLGELKGDSRSTDGAVGS